MPVDDPAGSLSFLLDHQAPLAGSYLVLYLLGGAAMAVVSLGVGERLAAASIFGLGLLLWFTWLGMALLRR